MDKTLIIAGAGQIGNAIAHLISTTLGWKVILADQTFHNLPSFIQQQSALQLEKIDLSQSDHLAQLIKKTKAHAIISCLPFYLNNTIAQAAHSGNVHYFDLTEDTQSAKFIAQLSQGSPQAFVTQCGLAPGFINIVAHDLMQRFDRLDTVKLRCGGLPVNCSNELKYAFTWSIDGLINEYNQPCPAIENGEKTHLTPLANLEHIQIDGLNYEAFNTSGGIGSLTQTYRGKLDSLTYKTIRYPGHRDKMKFLLQDLKLGKDPDMLKNILSQTIPHTKEDVVILFISAVGHIKEKLTRKSFVTKYYPKVIDDCKYSALQLTTASSAAAILNLVLNQPSDYQGYVQQERFKLSKILEGPFGQHLRISP